VTREKRSEAEIARKVVVELQSLGFETYEEVTNGGSRADIVGLRGPVVAVVETKATMSLAFLNQLLYWRGFAHLVIGACGYGRTVGAAHRLCQLEGIGLWSVGFESVREEIAPVLRRKAYTEKIRKRCVPENRTGETAYAQAGTNGGGYYTPFRKTARALTDIVRQKPGIALRDAMTEISHHYRSDATARSAMPSLIERGAVGGIRIEREGRLVRLYPTEQADGRSV
jgi:hypothetical protein